MALRQLYLAVLVLVMACGDSTDPGDPASFNGTWHVDYPLNGPVVWAEVTLTQAADSVHGMFEGDGPISVYYTPCTNPPTWNADACEARVDVRGVKTGPRAFRGRGYWVWRSARPGIDGPVWEDTLKVYDCFSADGELYSNGTLSFGLAGQGTGSTPPCGNWQNFGDIMLRGPSQTKP